MEKIIFNDCKELRILAEEMLNKKTNELLFVKDEGAYLVQSHERNQKDKSTFWGNKSGNLVAYGNWVISKNETISLNPQINEYAWDSTSNALGGDDFVEVLEFPNEILSFMEANTNYQVFINVTRGSIEYGIKQTERK